jgi:hypothetical protein
VKKRYFIFSDELEENQEPSRQMDIFEIISMEQHDNTAPLTVGEFLCAIAKREENVFYNALAAAKQAYQEIADLSILSDTSPILSVVMEVSHYRKVAYKQALENQDIVLSSYIIPRSKSKKWFLKQARGWFSNSKKHFNVVDGVIKRYINMSNPSEIAEYLLCSCINHIIYQNHAYIRDRQIAMSYKYNGYLRHYNLIAPLYPRYYSLRNTSEHMIYPLFIDWHKIKGSDARKFYMLPEGDARRLDKTIEYEGVVTRDTWSHLTDMKVRTDVYMENTARKNYVDHTINFYSQKCGNIRAHHNGIRMSMEGIGSIIEFFEKNKDDLSSMPLNKHPHVSVLGLSKAHKYHYEDDGTYHYRADGSKRYVESISFSSDVSDILDKVKKQAVRDKIRRVAK